MNVLIKGMEMPTEGTVIAIYKPNGKYYASVSLTAVYLYPVCSECGREHPIANDCPNCGARMEEEQK